ncbi:hypothetical protein MA16_Dca011472 [Dendrobium catenatum]|uniref:Uncharacterized protein n=1 Tax=Dendrobium catenatum TaxID=906689 RepID=A0A2I0WKB4_9ASPA|nr:hypothetical protein MA16_Dca011472 [Dendrobium catenatum]
MEKSSVAVDKEANAGIPDEDRYGPWVHVRYGKKNFKNIRPGNVAEMNTIQQYADGDKTTVGDKQGGNLETLSSQTNEGSGKLVNTVADDLKTMDAEEDQNIVNMQIVPEQGMVPKTILMLSSRNKFEALNSVLEEGEIGEIDSTQNNCINKEDYGEPDNVIHLDNAFGKMDSVNGYDPGPSEPSGFAAKWHHEIPVMDNANMLLIGIKSLRYESIEYDR